MAASALAAAYDRPCKREGGIVEYGMADTAGNNIYKGAFVMFDSTGWIIPGNDTASCVFAGVAAETVLQAADPGAEGTNKVKVYTIGDFEVIHDGTGAVTDLGAAAGISDSDNAVDIMGTLTNDVACGWFVEFVGTSLMWVRIDRVTPA